MRDVAQSPGNHSNVPPGGGKPGLARTARDNGQASVRQHQPSQIKPRHLRRGIARARRCTGRQDVIDPRHVLRGQRHI